MSPMTVSRVLNNSAPVDEKTRERVQKAIAKLDFRRNDLARNLRQGKNSKMIGLVIEDIANPFYSAIARGIDEIAQQHQYLIISGNHERNVTHERKLITAFLQSQVEGLLLVPTGSEYQELSQEIQLGMPVVFLDRPARQLEADAVLLDNRGGTRKAILHLLARGLRRIALVGDDPAVFTDGERIAGYREAHASQSVYIDESLLRFGPHDPIQAEAATKDLLALAEPPDAIFALNNRISVGVLNALHNRQASLPLLGFDDIELAHLLSIPITVIRHNPLDMGRQAAQLLFSRLNGDSRPPQRLLIPTEVVIRGSGT